MFILGRAAMALAIAVMSLVWVGLLVVVMMAGAGKLTSRLWDSAYAMASDSLPIR